MQAREPAIRLLAQQVAFPQLFDNLRPNITSYMTFAFASVSLQLDIVNCDHMAASTSSADQLPFTLSSIRTRNGNSRRSVAGSSSGSSSSSSMTAPYTPPSSPTSSDDADSPRPFLQLRTHDSECSLSPESASALGELEDSESDIEDEDLQQELAACSTWQDVLDIIGDEHKLMTPRNTVQALLQLVKFARSEPMSVRAELLGSKPFLLLLELIAVQLPAMNAFQVVNSLYSCAVLGAPLTRTMPTLMALIDGRLKALSHDFTPQDITSALYAHVTLKYKTPKDLLNLIARRAQSLLDSGVFEAQGISLLLWCHAHLGYQNQLVANSAVQQLRQGKFKELTSQGVGNVVWSLSKIREKHSPRVPKDILESALAYVKSHGSSCKPQEVMNVLSGCVQSRHHPQSALNTVVQFATKNIQVRGRA